MPTTSAPTRRATAMPAEERRAAIVQATVPLLAEHGEHVTSRQIAEAAGVAEGTIFRVFADKDELLSATLEAAVDQQQTEALYRSIPADLELEPKLIAAVDILQQRVVDVWELVSGLGPKLREQLHRPIVDSDALTEIFEAHDDELFFEPIRAARLLRALTLSVTHPMLFGDEMSSEAIVDQFLHGAGAR